MPESGTYVDVDLSSFDDPDRDHRVTKHIGWHPALVAKLLGNRDSREIAGYAVTLALGQRTCKIMFGCKAGRHRSL